MQLWAQASQPYVVTAQLDVVPVASVEDTNVVTLEQLARLTLGTSAPEGDVPVVRVGDLRNHRIERPRPDEVAVPAHSRTLRDSLAAGDVLFARGGDIGRTAVASTADVGHLWNNHLIRIRPHEAGLSHFLASCLESAAVRRWLRRHAVGSTITSIRVSELRQLPVSVPAPGVLARINAALADLDALSREESELAGLTSQLRDVMAAQHFSAENNSE